MKTQLLIASLLATTVACTGNKASRSEGDVNVGADTGTKQDLIGSWTQACRAGAFAGSGFGAGSETGTGTGSGTGSGGAGTGNSGTGVAIVGVGTGTGTGSTGQDQGGSTGQDQTGGGTGGTGGGTGGTGGGTGGTGGGTGGTVASTRNMLTINASQMVLKTQGFSSADCSGSQVFETTVNLTYTIPNYAPGTISNVDAVLNSATAMVTDSAAATAANSDQLCGFSNWVAGTSKNIARSSCLPNMTVATGTHISEILSYQNGNLSFGSLDATNNGASTDTRPTSLDRVPFTRDASGSGSGSGGSGTGSGSGT